MHSCNIPQTNSNFLVGQLQFVFKQFTLNEKSCSTSTQKTGKVRIIQTFVSVKSSAWDTVSLSNRLYFTTSKNKEIQHVIKKIHPNKNLPAIQAARLSTTSKKQMVQVKRVTNKLGGKNKKKRKRNKQNLPQFTTWRIIWNYINLQNHGSCKVPKRCPSSPETSQCS